MGASSDDVFRSLAIGVPGMQVDTPLFSAVKVDKFTCHAVALSITWRWEADTAKYWLDVKTWDESTGTVLQHSSNRFTWKDLDAVGDAGLAVRWIRQARQWLL